MAMKNCKECGTEISKGAKTCPKCGKDQRNFFLKHKVVTFILVVIVLGVIVGAGGTEKNNTVNTSTSQEIVNSSIEYKAVNIDELENALENNAAAAKDTYNGQYLEITGRLGTIDSDLKYISLLSLTDDFDMVGVHCSIMNNEQKEIIKTLTKDEKIIVKGKITNVGEVLGYYLDITEISK